MSAVTIRIEGSDLPGRRCVGLPGIAKPAYENVHVGVQHGREAVSLVPGDAAEACWNLDVEIVQRKDGRLDLRGPWVQGKPGDRFLYLTWGEVMGGGCFVSFRRAKLMLGAVDDGLLAQAASEGRGVVGRLRLTDARGGPVCAAVRPPAIQWSLADE